VDEAGAQDEPRRTTPRRDRRRGRPGQIHGVGQGGGRAIGCRGRRRPRHRVGDRGDPAQARRPSRAAHSRAEPGQPRPRFAHGRWSFPPARSVPICRWRRVRRPRRPVSVPAVAIRSQGQAVAGGRVSGSPNGAGDGDSRRPLGAGRSRTAAEAATRPVGVPVPVQRPPQSTIAPFPRARPARRGTRRAWPGAAARGRVTASWSRVIRPAFSSAAWGGPARRAGCRPAARRIGWAARATGEFGVIAPAGLRLDPFQHACG